jgi:endonuclease/exonuclease/phosphatase family metal-dependent hydrolase
MQLKILSWNIWCDGYFDQIAGFLKSSNADIMGLQEVLPHSKQIPIIELLTSIGYTYVYAAALDTLLANGETEEMGNAVFSKYPIISSKIHALSDKKRCIAVQADIALPENSLHVFSTHLVHTHQQPSEIQDLQAENLTKVLPTEKTIVMGDFNATLDSNAVKRMRELLKDTDSSSAPTWSVYPEGCPVCNPQKIDTRLDYIFASADIKSNSPKVESSKGSDHLPISVLVEI